MLQSLAVAIILGLIQSAFKNPAKKARLKSVLMDIHDNIELLYADDAPQAPIARVGNRFYKVQ